MKYDRYLVFVILILIMLFQFATSTAQENDQISFSPPFKQVWQTLVDARKITGYQIALTSSPLFDDRRVYFASTNGVIYGVFKHSWDTSWKFHTAAPITLNSVLTNGILCFTDGQSVYALDARTGVPVWIHNAPSAVTAGLADNKNSVSSGVAVKGGAVYYADILGSVRSLSIESGELLWEYKPSVEEDNEVSASVRSALFADNQYLLFGDDRGYLTALNSNTGERIWSFKTDGAIESGILKVEQRVFFGSNDNYIYCLDARNGSLNWKQRTAGDVRGMPVNDDEYVYITSRDRSLRVINMFNGYPARVGPIKLPQNFDFRPLLVSNLIYLPNVSSLLPRITEGTFRATTPYSNPAGEISTSLIYDADEKFLYFGTRTGHFVVIAPEALKLDQFLVTPEAASTVDIPTIDPTDQEDSEQRRRNRDRQSDETDQPAESEDQLQAVDDNEAASLSEDNEENPPAKIPPASDPAELIDEDESEMISDNGSAVTLEQGQQALKEGDLSRAASIISEALQPDPQKWYTINLGLYCKQDSIRALINSLSDEQLLIFARQASEQTCYFICLGLYEAREDAETAIVELKLNERVQADINALRLDSFIPVN